MLLVAGLILSVALAGVVLLGVLCVGLWRRFLALASELAALSSQLEEARQEAGRLRPGSGDLDRDLATFRERHPEFEVDVRPRR